MLGAVFVPLNYRAQADELAYMILMAGARVLMVGDRYGALVAGIRDRLRCVSQYVAMESPQAEMMPFEELIAQAPGEASEAEMGEGDLNILMYTSGTTGRPKGVMLTCGDFVAYVCGHTELDHPAFSQEACSSLEILAYGASPMPVPVIRRAIAMFPPTVGFVNAFGQTETTAAVTVLLPEDHRLEGSALEVERKLQRLASIGRPLPDVEVRIVDPEGADVVPGEIGEIAVRTRRLMKGYRSQDDATAQTIVNGWLHTRDMGWMDADGYLYLAGRKDDLIIRGGENISPAEVEAVLYAHPGIEEAAIIGIPDVDWGEQVMAVIVPRANSPLTAEEVIDWCHQRLASFKRPAIVQFVPALPRNALGKVLRKELREQFKRQC
jgi:acyl-CoA synthetase (AMP-forming)/AMP-acid ligase II